ncbi:iron-containing alcohol dehydrogenase [Acidocella aminolytica]|uniref:Alcohol dehydrogenase 2 n=1 Tax=Acidocella aminolytica 101 = DSM 11237 TaxID=1120923 RepID=A0A0D6PHL1_9PROT|nr:iron-containing alcohol dehydrogenase [Acidocella aminolytica]GAN80866.1 alcohol dehydrogenase iron-containing [Acidocella aminolytica 101 = DSM 11237]GBQ34240.1 alcohol dehydrogenase [Acidocella aminolytica 101 = DSM 11237]SHE31378.1 Alcohol dehydrogenase, class IV [Acidocella aminolytica 101 = DSM 11237]
MSALTLPRMIRVGGGVLAEAGQAVALLSIKRLAIITDKYLLTTGAVDRLQGVLAAQGIETLVFSDTVPDPTSDCVDAATCFVRAGGCDGVIGFGGGSPIDTAKAAAVLAVRQGKMRDLKAPHQEDNPALPIIAIPTTAGTGSEATRFTIVTDTETDEKMLCAGLAYLPVLSIVDYELTLTMPPRLTADTGIDALTHAIEAYVSRLANPFSDAMALSAMRAIWPWLPKAYHEPGNRTAREHVMFGALQAGIAFSNASVGLVHGMSRPIGAHFHVAHGLSNAMLLPAVTRWSIKGHEARYADCARTMGIATADAENAQAAAWLVEALRALNQELAVPGPRQYGLDGERWRSLRPLMAEQALASGSPGNNPRVPDAAQIIAIYDEVWG